MHNSSPSTNIIRDTDSKLNYIVTPNTIRTSDKIFESFKGGNHAFNLIGSFGTGKSSFLWALEKSLLQQDTYFKTPYNGKASVIKIIGDYKSLEAALNEEFGIENDLTANQKLFDAIFQRYDAIAKKNGLLVITIDEFGKFLEFAAHNQPEKEIYFLQKLAEFVNEPTRNILLLTSVHQSMEAYGSNLSSADFQEWKKVKGRFIDIPFNEPVEHLLTLASKKIDSESYPIDSESFVSLINENHLFNIPVAFAENVEKEIFPLSIISGYTIALAMQSYGQNERSLFTFLNSAFFSNYEKEKRFLELPDIYDYLFQEFYTLIVSSLNPDYAKWAGIRAALEKEDIIPEIDHIVAEKILKSVGLISLFAKKTARINADLLVTYLSNQHSEKLIQETIKVLEKHKVIRYSKFDDSFKLFEGTDLDIEHAISNASNKISGIDVLQKLNSHFEFPVIIAKSVSYRTGTPRLFEFILSQEPVTKTAEGLIDGYINLIFNENGIDDENLQKLSKTSNTLFGYFTNTSGIFETLLEIEKTQAVLKDIEDENDRVAIKELRSIIKSNENLLNHYVMNSLYTDKVEWFANGGRRKITDKNNFNKALSAVCDRVYPDTPILQNELINRHKTSGSIGTARRNFWRALTNNFHLEDLGFPNDKWPAEKTIYFSLLKKTGIHSKSDNGWILGEPLQESFMPLWNLSLQFLDDAKSSRKCLLDFVTMLEAAPIKLKQGVIDFWIPTFLYIKRGDFALYNDNGFVPYLDETVLHALTRNLKEYTIKSFELNNLRLSLFNKYRDFLKQEITTSFNTDSFIQSIRPLLIFYRDLPDYNKKTNTVSQEARKLREAISKAKDPEKTFFEDFPDALGYSLVELANDNNLFEDYIIDFQNRIEEIKQSFDELLNRFELFICDEIIGKRVPFETYKKHLQHRFSAIKEHQALTRHKIFLLRVTSDLPDRDSYLMSIGQAIVGARLDAIKDSDEVVLKDKFLSIVRELDNLVDLNKVEVSESEDLVKLELTTPQNGSVDRIIRISNKQRDEVQLISEELAITLNKYQNLKLPILLALLQKELNKE
jgi:hypothetical protein